MSSQFRKQHRKEVVEDFEKRETYTDFLLERILMELQTLNKNLQVGRPRARTTNQNNL